MSDTVATNSKNDDFILNDSEIEDKCDTKRSYINISSLLEYFRKLNDFMDQEEEFDRQQKKIRRIIYKHSLLTKKLLPFFKFILDKINSKTQQEIFNKNSHRLLENHKELIANLKLVKTLNELLKLIVDLTSPFEFLFLNHNLVFIILNHFDLIVKHTPTNMEIPDFLNEINILTDEQLNSQEISNLIDVHLGSFKENLLKSGILSSFGESLNNLIDYYTSLSSTFHSQKIVHQNATNLRHFKLLKNILFDSLILNLALIRNLTVDKNEPNYTLIVNNLFESKVDNFLIQLSNLSKINKSFSDNRKYDQRAFVCYSLVVQIMSLLFSKMPNRLVQYSNRSNSPSVSSSSSNCHQLLLQSADLKSQQQLLKKHLNKLAKKFSKSDSFANLIEQMLRLITKPVDLYVYFDLSYYFWFLKFFVQNFISKQLKESSDSDSKEIQEDSKIKKALINYDLFTFIVFSILENFEQLVFDSNYKNMNLLRLFKLKNIGIKENDKNKDQFCKVTNINCLKLLCLSIGCLYELLDYVNHYLEFFLNSFKPINQSSLTEEISEFFIYLNEFLHFDELKQMFPLLMRFYCYNQHVYSNSLVKSIFLTNQLYLITYKNSFELIIKLKTKEPDRDSELVNSDTNATKNSSTNDSISLTYQSLNLNELYSMYANTHTSYILKHVLTQFVNNDPTLNRCVIDFLDSLMCETNKHEYLFHMNFALALANIATLDNYRLLDQRTKDLISNMLCGIRRLCKKRPHFANKILFNIHCSNEKIGEEDESTRRKRKKQETNSGSDPFVDSDSLSISKNSTCSSSWSSLKSTSIISPSDSLSDPKNYEVKFENSDTEDELNQVHFSPSHHPEHLTELTKELRILIENEFLFCIRSLDVFKKSHLSNSRKLDAIKLTNFIIKNDHLYRIFNYLVDLFDSASPNLSNEMKVNSWQIFNCLENMKFTMDDKINYLNELNNSYLSGSKFTLGINIGFGPFKNDFFKSSECISLRQACSTDEFRKHLKEAYVKYLVDKLCMKSKRTRNAIFWVLNILKCLKSFLNKKSIYLNKNTNDVNQLNLTNNIYGSNPNFNIKLISSSSTFQMKLINFYHIYNLGVPLVPFTYELQQVFHSADFSHLLDIFGITRTNRGFPFVPNDWLDYNRNKLNECLSLMEKCLCI